jgi:very-short-patch-repair endonuclease
MGIVSEARWQYRELQRLWRLMFPEQSARLLIKTVGPFWLWRHGARREYKVSLWKGAGWYCIDVALPRRKVGLEAKGGWRKYYDGDIVRDQELSDRGWHILRITEVEMHENPAAVRRRVRKFVRR